MSNVVTMYILTLRNKIFWQLLFVCLFRLPVLSDVNTVIIKMNKAEVSKASKHEDISVTLHKILNMYVDEEDVCECT